ncbi:MAG: hypothetical protein HQL17_05750 [Candidatus Omnitrophica bacterium]|nr:hypothetical protein [Candidatus Omnitrophota bacterium]
MRKCIASIILPIFLTNYFISPSYAQAVIAVPNPSQMPLPVTPGGLLTKEIDPKGNAFTHVFDVNGRITEAKDEEGGSYQFSRQVDGNGDIIATVTSAEGNVVTYMDRPLFGSIMQSTISVSGISAPTRQTRSADGLNSAITRPDQTIENYQSDLKGFGYTYKTPIFSMFFDGIVRS